MRKLFPARTSSHFMLCQMQDKILQNQNSSRATGQDGRVLAKNYEL